MSGSEHGEAANGEEGDAFPDCLLIKSGSNLIQPHSSGETSHLKITRPASLPRIGRLFFLCRSDTHTHSVIKMGQWTAQAGLPPGRRCQLMNSDNGRAAG